jgi:hypothetical protein
LFGTAARFSPALYKRLLYAQEEKRVNMNYGEQIAARNDQEGPVAHSSTAPESLLPIETCGREDHVSLFSGGRLS